MYVLNYNLSLQEITKELTLVVVFYANMSIRNIHFGVQYLLDVSIKTLFLNERHNFLNLSWHYVRSVQLVLAFRSIYYSSFHLKKMRIDALISIKIISMFYCCTTHLIQVPIKCLGAIIACICV